MYNSINIIFYFLIILYVYLCIYIFRNVDHYLKMTKILFFMNNISNIQYKNN